MSIDKVHGTLSSEPIAKFVHPCILIKINDTYSDTDKRGAIELYEATRGTWRVSLANASNANYALAVYAGSVREVYETAAWLPPESTVHADADLQHAPPERCEFVGRIAPEPVRRLYRWKSVAHLDKPRAANPIRYVGPDQGRRFLANDATLDQMWAVFLSLSKCARDGSQLRDSRGRALILGATSSRRSGLCRPTIPTPIQQAGSTGVGARWCSCSSLVARANADRRNTRGSSFLPETAGTRPSPNLDPTSVFS